MRNSKSKIVGFSTDSILKLIFLLSILKTENFLHVPIDNPVQYCTEKEILKQNFCL